MTGLFVSKSYVAWHKKSQPDITQAGFTKVI
jgi:hypothetical protein